MNTVLANQQLTGIFGPAVTTENAFARYNAAGTALKNSLTTEDASGNVTLGNIAAGIAGDFVVENGGVLVKRTAAEILGDLGASPTSHRHDTEILELDAINSDGGAFPFTVTGDITISGGNLIKTGAGGGNADITLQQTTANSYTRLILAGESNEWRIMNDETGAIDRLGIWDGDFNNFRMLINNDGTIGVGDSLYTRALSASLDFQFSSASDLLMLRLWNYGAGGSKMRFLGGNNAESQHQWTTSSYWLGALVMSDAGGMSLRVRKTGDANSEAAVDAGTRMQIDRDANILWGGATAPASMVDGHVMVTGTDPTSNIAGQFSHWAKDLGGGNIGPAWQTFNGTVIQLDQSLLTTDDVQFDTMDLVNQTAGDDILTIKAAANQTGKALNVTDSADASLAWITGSGRIQTEKGFRGDSTDWLDSLGLWTGNEFTPEHTGCTGDYDHTGGTYERLFTNTAGDDFAIADIGNFIVLNSGTYKGAKARITDYIDVNNVIIYGPGWDGDLSSVTYSIYPPPTFIVADNHNVAMLLNTEGSFFLGSDLGPTGWNPTGDTSSLLKVKCKTSVDNLDAMMIDVNCNGKANIDALQIFYETGDLQDGDENQVLQISINESGASGGHIDGLLIETTNSCDTCEKHGIHVSAGFDNAFTVTGSPFIDMAYGYTVLADHTPTDHVGGGSDQAFLKADATDVTIFDNDNDYILIGHSAVFEILEVVLATVSSKNISPVFEYSTGNGTWDTLVVDDSTANFTQSGLIDWEAPGGWNTTNKADGVTGDITAGYYIRITRTRGTIPTEPIEEYFRICLEQGGDTSYKVKGDGRVKLPYLTAAPTDLENGDTWMEADGLHIYYGGAEKLVAGV